MATKSVKVLILFYADVIIKNKFMYATGCRFVIWKGWIVIRIFYVFTHTINRIGGNA